MAYYNGYDLMRFCGKLAVAEQPYWYATLVQHCTQTLYERKSADYPDYYTRGAELYGANYQRDIDEHYLCMDCVGMLKGFFWSGGQNWKTIIKAIGNPDIDIPRDYQGYNVPDYSADQMYNYFKNDVGEGYYGPIDTLPIEESCLMLHSSGHCGVYVGNNHSLECSFGWSKVIYLPLDNRRFGDWEEWCYFPDWLITRQHYAPYNPYRDIIDMLPIIKRRRKIGGVYGYGF